MALLVFPATPSNGDVYPTSPVPGQNQYQYDAPTLTWRLLGAATTVVPGCYGDAFTVPSFCVDALGRLTSVTNVPIAYLIPDLQAVTAQGAVTTDTIDVGGLVAAGLTYPNVDGASGDYLTTDGAGTLSWITPPVTPDLDAVTTAGNTTANTIDVGALIAASLTYPTVDGTAGDYLTTDGVGTLSWVTPPTTPDLDAVTTAGNTTTNTIDVGALIAASLTYPTADGVSGDYLTTDGAGTLSWVALPATPDLDTVTAAGNVTTNTIDVGGLTAAGLSYPLTDGTANQVLTTNGTGTLSWSSTLSVVSPPGLSGAAGALGQVAYDSVYFYWYDGARWQRVAADTTPW